jgi:conjugal transfer pilus assembly protein TraB
LTPEAKRNLAVAGFAAAGLTGVVGLALLAPEVAQPVNKQAVVKHILTDTDPRALGLDGLAAQLREQSRRFTELQQKLRTIEEQQKAQRLSDEERFKRYSAAERQAYDEQMKALAAEVERLRNPPGRAEGAAPEKRPQRPDRPSRGPGDNDDLDAVFEQASRAPAP